MSADPPAWRCIWNAYKLFRQMCVTYAEDEADTHRCGDGDWPGDCKRYGKVRAMWEAINSRYFLWDR